MVRGQMVAKQRTSTARIHVVTRRFSSLNVLLLGDNVDKSAREPRSKVKWSCGQKGQIMTPSEVATTKPPICGDQSPLNFPAG